MPGARTPANSLADRQIGNRCVDHDHDGGRDHGAQGSARADGAGGEHTRIAVLQHRRYGHHTDDDLDGADNAGRGRDHRRHGHGREGQAARQAAEPHPQRLEQALRDPGALQHEPHEHERRHRREQELRRGLRDPGIHLQPDHAAIYRQTEQERDREQRKRDRQAQEHQHEQCREHQGGQHLAAHVAASCVRSLGGLTASGSKIPKTWRMDSITTCSVRPTTPMAMPVRKGQTTGSQVDMFSKVPRT